ncbi:PREDICTED: leucine-rich PPR motif-containing protein, mitochondrial-like [Dinoponera quadriceps]|uniref:Leucine-rich PPR motif-containing protein, mitochondrial-like n=1 Tax=Dinoponera quadriceps TaxID=609295 RepID=A0A6P3WRC8_DINQU|nr:PREDICTED: leucine-rich PPR motif-containing protein, mitochondrial-like [Dinoponera quadriceps]
MIEADKMLHLRKYVLTILRNDARSRVVRTLHSTSARKGGYVLRSLHHCYVPPTVQNSRSNYAVCGIRTFSTTVAQSLADDADQKLTSFCDDVKHGQTWSADRLKEIVRLCDESNYQLQPSTGVLLLKCCGNPLSTVELNERQDLADRVWRLAKRNALTLEHYNTLLNVYAENSNSVDPKEFLAEMNVTPNDDTYRLLFNTAVKTGNTEHLQNIMSVMKASNILLGEDTFCSLIQIYMAKGNITEALNMIAFAQDAKLPVDKLYTELACGYAAQGDIPNLVKILNDEPQSNLSLLKIIKSLSVSDNGRHIPVVVNFLSTVSTIKPEINNLITELVRADRIADANALINCIALNDIAHVKSFANNFLTQLIMTNAPVEDIVKFANSFIESGSEPMALTNVAEISLKLSREKQSLVIFTTMQKKGLEIRPHYYWPLLLNAHRNEGEAKIYSLVASMNDMNVEFDFDTFASYVFPYVNTANPIITLQKLKLIGIPGNLLTTPMIHYLLSSYRLEDVMCLYEYALMKLDYRLLMRSLTDVYFAKRDVENCVKVLTTFKSGHKYVSLFLFKLIRNSRPKLPVEEFQSLLEAFEKHQVKFSSRDATFLKHRLDHVNNPADTTDKLYKTIDRMTNKDFQHSLLTTIPHPKYMTTKELACHFVELKSHECGTKTILHRLLEAYYLENNLKRAEEVKKEYDENRYTWTPGMKIILFDLYVKHNKLKEAEKLLLEVQKMSNTFSVDSTKILFFAIALVKTGKTEAAFNIIENFSNVNNWKNMDRSCAKLLNALAESRYKESTKSMLDLLIRKNYCNISTELLRPLVAIPLRQNDIPSAVETFKACMRIHRKLPLAVEVFTALLREKENSHLQDVNKHINEVYDMMALIKSVEVANTIVVIALANLNKMEELRVILQKQRIATNTIMHYVNFAQRTNDVHALLRIVEASENSNNVNQSLLCDTLLTFYSKTGDCTNALALWELMRAKNIEPSKLFKQGFIEFFRSNRATLPAEFESDESEVNVTSN